MVVNPWLLFFCDSMLVYDTYTILSGSKDKKKTIINGWSLYFIPQRDFRQNYWVEGYPLPGLLPQNLVEKADRRDSYRSS